MRTSLISAVAACRAVAVFPLAAAHAAPGGKTSTHGSFTYAVYGDAPYGVNPTDTSETEATPAFIDAVNADPMSARSCTSGTSTPSPLEYLKLVITPGGHQPTTASSFGPFSWSRHMED